MVTVDSYDCLLCLFSMFLLTFLIKNELENPVHIELNNTIIEPNTDDSPYF